MDCRAVEEHFEAYLLGAVDSEEREMVERHIDSCPECSFKLGQEADIAVELARAVPQFEAPTNVKVRLFSRIEQALTSDLALSQRGRLGVLPHLGRALVAYSGLAIASVLVGIIVVGGGWFNGRLNRVEEEKAALAAQLRTVADGRAAAPVETFAVNDEPGPGEESQANDTVRGQRHHIWTFVGGAGGAYSNVLLDAGLSASSQSVAMGQGRVPAALLTAFQMPTDADGQAYEIWLIKGLGKYKAGFLTVDSTGYGQTIIRLYFPPSYYDAIEIVKVDPQNSGDFPPLGVMRGDF